MFKTVASFIIILVGIAILWIPPLEQYSFLQKMAPNLIWFGLTWLVTSTFVKYLFHNALLQKSRRTVPKLIQDLTASLLWLLSLFVFLSMYHDYNLIGLWTASSVTIAVLGFALKGMLLDIFSGIAMGLDQPFKIGDWIEADDGLVGQVESINWRVTKIVSLDNITQVIPNSILASLSIKNYGSESYFRTKVNLELDYNITTHRAERILLGAASKVSAVEKAPTKPDVKISALTNRGVNWELRFWLDDYRQRDILAYEVQKNILRNLHISGLSVSKEKMDVTYTRQRQKSERNDVEFLLSNTDIFKSFNTEEIEHLSSQAQRRLYLKDEAIINYGEEGDSLFLLLEGVLSVHIPSHENKTNFIEVAKISSGEFFGEMSLLTNENRTATVKADIDSIVYEIKRDHIRPLLEQREEILTALNTYLLQRTQANERYQHQPTPAQKQQEIHDNLLNKIRHLFFDKK